MENEIKLIHPSKYYDDEDFKVELNSLNNGLCRVVNSHAYGVILTHLTCYSRTHAIDKFTHAFLKNHTHTQAI